MIDINELRRLAQEALAVPDGLSAEWMDRLGQFQEAADASVVSELLDRLEAAEKERDGLRHSFNEWIDKTEWVQRGINEGTISPKYLGLHRADVMASLLGEAEKERDALRSKVAEMGRQEPVGWFARIDGDGPLMECKHADISRVPLYLAAGAQSAPSVPDSIIADAARYQFLRNGGAYLEPNEGEIYMATDYGAKYYKDLRDLDMDIDEALAAAPEAKP